jgi:hypothetical protein
MAKVDIRPDGGMDLDERSRRLHTLAYLAVMALTAWVVYRKLGLSLLRRAWLNMDWVWAGALVLTGLVVLLKWSHPV